MKTLRVLAVLIFTFYAYNALSQDNRVMCDVTEYNKSVSVVFGENVKYLGTDYKNQIGLYDDNNQLKFDKAIDVVSYLCSRWGWKQCGNPVFKNNGKTKIYTLEHKIDNVLPNLLKQMELFKEYEKSLQKGQ